MGQTTSNLALCALLACLSGCLLTAENPKQRFGDQEEATLPDGGSSTSTDGTPPVIGPATEDAGQATPDAEPGPDPDPQPDPEPDPVAVCGDGTCQATESCGTCSQDCGACPSLIANGTFESGLSSWGVNGTASVVSNNAHTGSNASRQQNGGVWQNLGATAGMSFKITAWGKNTGTAGVVGINFFSAGFATQLGQAQKTIPGTGSYQEVSISAVAPAGTAAATVWTWADGSVVYIDDISVINQ